MAHECPECGMVCYCGGDIDDCEFNGEGSGQETCTHKCDIGGGEDDGWEPEDRDMPEQLTMACSYPGCCMPGPHFPSECHNAQDIENHMRCERVTPNVKAQPDAQNL